MELGKLGTVQIDENTWGYFEDKNPLLQKNVFASFWDGKVRMLGAAMFAKAEAAEAMAKVVGGVVVPDARYAFITILAPATPALAIQIGEAEPVNAGELAGILGNDTGEFSTVRGKSWHLSARLGLGFDPTLADRLFTAVKGLVG